jgi:hypothetical protein
MPRKTGKIVNVETLRVGDLVAQDDGAHYQLERYAVEVIGINPPDKQHGLNLLSFRVRIASGPDRVGEVGNMLFGSGGVARRIGRIDRSVRTR